ncbi:MAG: transporter substrate-binding domain-containing protein [Helicobacteraceae bacterium]
MNFFAADARSSTISKIVQNGELRVGLDPGYMPFEMRDKRGQIIGYDVDLAKKIAKEMGVKLTIVPTSFDGIIGGLLSDKFDMIISAITITQARNLQVNFSEPYVVIGQTLLVNRALKNKIKKVSDLDDKKYKIVTKLGVTGEIVAKKYFKNAKIVTFDTESDALSEVLNSKADAFIYDQPYNILFMTDKGKDRLIHYDTPLSYEPLAIAIRKGDPDFLNWLNNFMRQIKEDKIENFHHNLYEKWLKDTAWFQKVK